MKPLIALRVEMYESLRQVIWRTSKVGWWMKTFNKYKQGMAKEQL
jgi:hypothetical protein